MIIFVNIIKILLTHFINLYCINLLIKPRFSKIITYILLSLFFVFLSVANLFVSPNENNFNDLKSGFLVAVIICTVLVFILSKDKFPIKLFYIMTYVNIFTIIQVISSGICYSFFSLDNYELYHFHNVFIRSMILIPICILYQIFGRKYIVNNIDENNKNWWLLSLTSIAMLLMMMLIAVKNNYFETHSLTVHLYLFIGIIIVLLVYSVVFINISLTNKTIGMEKIKLKNDLLNAQIDILNKQEKEMAKLRHDFRHHNLYVIECASNNDSAAIVKYLQEYNENIEKLSENKLCTNDTINMTLAVYKNKAITNKIKFLCQVKVHEIYIKDTDLISILGNILENALNSCLQYTKDNPEIEVFIKEIGNKLCFICNNSCNDDIIIEEGMIKNKGIGIASVIDVVSRYDGEINYQKKDKISLTILIPNILL